MDLEQLKKRASASSDKYKVKLSKRNFGASSAVDAMVSSERKSFGQSFEQSVKSEILSSSIAPKESIKEIGEEISASLAQLELEEHSAPLEVLKVVEAPITLKLDRVVETVVNAPIIEAPIAAPVTKVAHETVIKEVVSKPKEKLEAKHFGLSTTDILSEYFLNLAGHDEVTPPMSIHTISNDVGISYNTVKVTLQRMKKSRPQLIDRSTGGHWGFIVVRVSELARQEKRVVKPIQREYQIDISPLANRGLTQTHVKQILNKGILSEAELQKSIHDFANDLNFNFAALNIRSSPIRFFLGIVLKGNAYSPVKEVSKEQIEKREADQKALQDRLALKRQEAELQKQAEEFNSKFEAWKLEQTPEFLLSVIRYEDGQFARPKLVQEKEYFRNHVLNSL